jgi:hypothetical protein
MPESRKNPKPEKCLKMRQNPANQLNALLGGKNLIGCFAGTSAQGAVRS